MFVYIPFLPYPTVRVAGVPEPIPASQAQGEHADYSQKGLGLESNPQPSCCEATVLETVHDKGLLLGSKSSNRKDFIR